MNGTILFIDRLWTGFVELICWVGLIFELLEVWIVHNDLLVAFSGHCLGCVTSHVNRWPPKYRLPIVQHQSGDYSHRYLLQSLQEWLLPAKLGPLLLVLSHRCPRLQQPDLIDHMIKQLGQIFYFTFCVSWNHLSLICKRSGYHFSMSKFGEAEKLVPKFIRRFLQNTPAICASITGYKSFLSSVNRKTF